MIPEERIKRNVKRMGRAIKRVMRRPKYTGMLSLPTAEEQIEDLKRIVRHAEKIGWMKRNEEIGIAKKGDKLDDWI